ncbi:MAG: TraR/DksA family transcriptional regulator [Syntrophobacteraceae bacterium]|jgi:DnaK suppressor protein
MNKEVPQEFIKSLGILLEEIMRRQRVLFSALADINSARDPLDIADLASSHSDRESIHSMQHRNYRLIREISALSRRIKDGSFGICDECSDSIDIERLRVQPTATLCINCQRTREMENRATAA